MIRYGPEFIVLKYGPTPNPQAGGPPLSATAYSIYSQLLSIPGGLRTRHAVVTRDSLYMEEIEFW
jgi:hypothetical protein